MLITVLLGFLLNTKALAQLNGEFWWLNGKLAKTKGVTPPPWKYEAVSDLETDESDKVVFHYDNTKFDNKKELKSKPNDSILSNNLVRPEDKQPNDIVSQNNMEDRFDFIFPEDNDSRNRYLENKTALLDVIKNENNKKIHKKIKIDDKIVFEDQKENNKPNTVHICTYLNSEECKQRNGLNYKKFNIHTSSENYRKVCCILPLKNNNALPAHSPDSEYLLKRQKRSEDNINTGLKQRNAIMSRNIAANNRRGIQFGTTEEVSYKTSDSENDYVDPYWNIRSSIKKPSQIQNPYQTNTDYDDVNDYVEDYTMELPIPGLKGLYSDDNPNWSFNRPNGVGHYNNEDDDNENKPLFGYSTIDPRTIRNRLKIKNAQLSSTPKQYVAESQTISYGARPDFNVFQGFKLPFLVSNNKMSISETNSEETVKIGSEQDYESSKEDELYFECGVSVASIFENEDTDIGQVRHGAQPWLAMIVPTKRQQSMLCYATVVHPRAAITTADCVYEKSSGDLTLVVGQWDLKDPNPSAIQRRMVSIYLHSRYKPGDTEHNLSFLHWKRALLLSTSVQPACLEKPRLDKNCKFVGWGGYDQAIRSKPKWQKASLLKQRTCKERFSSIVLPSNSICALVNSRTTMTGIGGPLICDNNDHQSVVGIAVRREKVIVILPIKEWALKTAKILGIID